jgi:hypothetical protein
VADFDDEDGYQGSAVLDVGERRFDVRVELRGYFQPIDGRYHWYGRIAADPALAEALAAGRRRGTLTTPEGTAPADVGDPDPWGRFRVEGVSTPPFASWFTTGQPPASAHEGELPEHVRVAVIGAGFGGIGAGVKLLEAGIRDFAILERGASVGGTWRDNTYPGCACDVPSHLYSFSFAPNPRWSRSFSGQPEIRAYLEDVADRPGLRARMHFDTAVTGAVWQDPMRSGRWSTTRGDLTADVVISAGGPLSDPSMPDIPGSPSSPARSSTRPAGTTRPTWPASASPSSAPAPRRSSSCRSCSARPRSSCCSSARPPGSCRAATGR